MLQLKDSTAGLWYHFIKLLLNIKITLLLKDATNNDYCIMLTLKDAIIKKCYQ